MAGATVSPVEAKIGQIIKDFSTESSFTAEAMKQFMELKEMVTKYENQIEGLQEHKAENAALIAQLNDQINSMGGHIDQLEGEKQGFLGRESELLDREMQCSVNEVRMECANARVEDHQSMVGLIFRNTELRKRTTGQELVVLPGTPDNVDQYGNTIHGSGEPPMTHGVPVAKDETSSEE